MTADLSTQKSTDTYEELFTVSAPRPIQSISGEVRVSVVGLSVCCAIQLPREQPLEASTFLADRAVQK